jgi:inosine-uridine nucleoside N-ribohydrolase
VTFEERIDAIAMSLELTNQSLEQTRQVLNALAEAQAKTEEIVDKLAMIARSHNDRISRLESQ